MTISEREARSNSLQTHQNGSNINGKRPTDCLNGSRPRPPKKHRLDNDNESRRHPLGVRPAGNAYLAEQNLMAAAGGFKILPEELIAILLEYLEPADLLRLGGSCRALHAFTRNEELWRTIFTE